MVLEIVGGALLSAFLQVLFDRMASRQFLDFFLEKKLDRSLLQDLKIALLSVNAFLSDAEEKQIMNPSVKEWLDELKDAVYDAEDILDAISTEALRCKLEFGSETHENQVLEFNTSLKNIVDRLKPLAKQKDLLSLKESLGGKPLPRLPTTSLVDESEVFGRNNDKDQIIDFLLSDGLNGSEIPVIAIVGMGGVGKTTLAQLLYNDQKVKNRFGLRAWAYVSEEFDVFKVTKTIYESVNLSNCNIRDLNVLQLKLKKRLMGRRFLLVLDDVWNENFADWDVLRRPFIAGTCGSRVIVTTRSHGVASILRARLTHPLRHLSHKDCWSLFAKHAFKTQNPHLDPTLEAIGRKIVHKCEGLPLAAKTIGGLLHSKVELGEWDSVLNSKIWDLPNDKSNILPALRLSYYHLPSNLKRCFAYCSIFPKGYEIEIGNLVQLWMAQGLVQPPKSKQGMGEVGNKYFHELLSRSFFQQSSLNKSCFVMHDLINDLAQHVAGEFCFKFEDGDSHEISEKTRHISYLPDQYEAPIKFEAFYGVQRLRTFLPLKVSSSTRARVLSPTVLDNLSSTLSCLRALSLSPYHRQITKLPDSIGRLKHLRYLDLSRTAIERLPEMTSSLYNLETLLLSDCHFLTQLPTNMCNLVNLQHLDISGRRLKEMPPEFGKLEKLQLLTTFVLSRHSGSRISELGKLFHLNGTLSIMKLQNADATNPLNANLKDKKYLSELVFQWDTDSPDLQNETDVFDQLRPHENLKKLTIKSYGGTKFPNWLGDSSFSKMVSLHLTDCINCSSLPPLGQLSSLRELYVAKLKGIERVGPEFYGNSSSSIKPFRSLKTLQFKEMPDWKDWLSCALEDGEFPSLQELYLQECQELTGNLPSHLPSLKFLHIHECMKLEFQPEDTTLQYTALQQLHIRSSCDSLQSFPLDFFSGLEDLQIQSCRSLKFIGMSEEFHEDLTFLQNLEIKNCPNLEFFPGSGLSALRVLKISECPELMSFLEGGLLSNLQYLSIHNCDKLTPRMDWGLHNMPSLISFEIKGGCNNMELFPEEGLLPATLIFLHIEKLQDLQSLDHRGLQHLTSLATLEIHCCNRLNCISEEKLPASLSLLSINECSLMTRRCQDETGKDWDKISHIPNRYIYD